MRFVEVRVIQDDDGFDIIMTAWEHDGHFIEVTEYQHDRRFAARIDEGVPVIKKTFTGIWFWVLNQLKQIAVKERQGEHVSSK